MKKRKVYYCICLLVAILFANFFDRSLKITKPDLTFTLISFFSFFLLCIAFYLKGAKKTLFILIPYLFVFIMVEVGLRIWISRSASRSAHRSFLTASTMPKDQGEESVYVPHHYTLYNPRPNLKLPDGTMHNNLGMRDNRDFPKNDGAIRIVFIGGSTTYTINILDNRQIFSYRLETLLNDHYQKLFPGIRIQVINAGMGGATSAENMLRLIFFVSELDPDLVVIQHGLNDVWPRMYGTIQSDFSNYRKRWGAPNYFLRHSIAYGFIRRAIDNSVLLTFLSRKMGLIDRLTQIEDVIVRRDVVANASNLIVNSADYFIRNTRYMVAICKCMGADFLLATEAYTEKAGATRNAAMPEHNAILKKIAAEEGGLFYDFFSDMAKDDLHMPDGRHVNRLGSDLKADLFYSFFVKNGIIQKLRERHAHRLHPDGHSNDLLRMARPATGSP